MSPTRDRLLLSLTVAILAASCLFVNCSASRLLANPSQQTLQSLPLPEDLSLLEDLKAVLELATDGKADDKLQQSLFEQSNVNPQVVVTSITSASTPSSLQKIIPSADNGNSQLLSIDESSLIESLKGVDDLSSQMTNQTVAGSATKAAATPKTSFIQQQNLTEQPSQLRSILLMLTALTAIGVLITAYNKYLCIHPPHNNVKEQDSQSSNVSAVV